MIDVDMVIRRMKVGCELGLDTFDATGHKVHRSVVMLLSRAGPWDHRTIRAWCKGRSRPKVPDAEKLDRVLRSWGF